MRILAVDTASGSGSAAVSDGDHLLAEFTTARRETHSKHLMSIIDRVIHRAGLRLSDIDGFAVTRGPGSFTGLRIGIATVKGLALVTRKPVVGVSSLAALAMQAAQAPGEICAMLDARNQEVYFSRYRFENGCLESLSHERAATPMAAIATIREPCLFVGDGAVKYREMLADKLGPLAGFALPYQHVIRASIISYLSQSRFEGNQTDDVASLAPRYIRKSYAQMNKKQDSAN